MSYLFGQMLNRTQLRFSQASPLARHEDPRRGLRSFGPYDVSTFGREKVTAVIICPAPLTAAAERLSLALTKGTGYFPGFQAYFRTPLRVVKTVALPAETPDEIERAVRQVSGDGPDLVYVVTGSRNDTQYSTAKGMLLGNGIPSQVVTAGHLEPGDQLQWVIENIALASYAKVGGTPWVVAATKLDRQVVIGVSRVQDRSGSMMVGIVTMFTQDGDFLLADYMASKLLEWNTDRYVSGLAELISGAYREYQREYGAPATIVLHLCKRPGKSNEVEAALRAVRQIGADVPFALVHLNDDTNFRLFDTAQPNCIPPSGLVVSLSKHRSVMLLDGLVAGRRVRRGVPSTLEVSLDARSTVSRNSLDSLVQQVADFSRVNWRAFNAYASPATLNYSYLIAKMISEVGAARWNTIVAKGRLHDKAWFL